MEKFGAWPPLFVPAGSSRQRLLRRSTTYLAKIAVALQQAPSKMLTFSQLIEKLKPLLCEERKSIENNIRVCLSSNKCFVKIPVLPDCPDSKRNYWKLDPSQITAKMVRRHFKGLLQLFPELALKVETENMCRAPEHPSTPGPPQPASCGAVHIRCEVKFSGPFSIEALLKRDGPSARAPRAAPVCGASLREEQQQQPAGMKSNISWASQDSLLLQAPAARSPLCPAGGSTLHGLSASRAAKPVSRMPVVTEASFPVYSRTSAAPHFTSPHSSYTGYSVPTFTHNALRLCL